MPQPAVAARIAESKSIEDFRIVDIVRKKEGSPRASGSIDRLPGGSGLTLFHCQVQRGRHSGPRISTSLASASTGISRYLGGPRSGVVSLKRDAGSPLR